MRVLPVTVMSLWGLAFPAIAQAQSTGSGVKAGIEAQGDVALDRLKDAVAGRKSQTPAVGPAALPAPAPEVRRRAFDALRGRAPTPVMDARARAALETGRADVAQQRGAMTRRLGQALGLDEPDMAALAKGATPPAQQGWVPVLFVSSSMPIPTLRTYAAQLEKARGVLAFRGIPGGLRQVAPMAKLSAEILRLDPGCEGPACAMSNVQLIVDPIVFRQHGVSRVPALALVPGDPAAPYCEREEQSPRSRHIVSGDAALSGLLEEFARLGGNEEVRDAQSRLEPR